jgi:hypothetical protein
MRLAHAFDLRQLFWIDVVSTVKITDEERVFLAGMISLVALTAHIPEPLSPSLYIY